MSARDYTFNLRELFDDYEERLGDNILLEEAKRELARLEAVEAAARQLIEDCGWNVPILDQHGEYDIAGHLLMELCAALADE